MLQMKKNDTIFATTKKNNKHKQLNKETFYYEDLRRND